MEAWLLYLMMVAAIGIGWWLGSRERRRAVGGRRPGRSYYQGLNLLLNGEPDRAVNAFIEGLEVNDDTLDTHLALGALLRRRGELEKAVTVHENILNHPRLDLATLHIVQLELAKDYLLAGLLDRAEAVCARLIRDVGGRSPTLRYESLKINLEIYEREKEWRQAIEVARELVSAKGKQGDRYETSISHYYCELAEEYLAGQQLEQAHEAVREAIGHDVNNPRTSLLRGRIDVAEGQFDNAITALTRIRDQDPIYVAESLDPLAEAYHKGGRPQQELQEYLASCLTVTPSISIVLALTTSIRAHDGDEAAAKFIAGHLKKNPTVRGLTHLIDLHIDNARGVAKENLAILRSFAEALVADKPQYRCQVCGFEGKLMRWHCPQCKDWATIKPIFGIEGE